MKIQQDEWPGPTAPLLCRAFSKSSMLYIRKAPQESPSIFYYTENFSGSNPVASRNRLLHCAVPQVASSPCLGPHGGLFAPSRRASGAYSCALATPNFRESLLWVLHRRTNFGEA